MKNKLRILDSDALLSQTITGSKPRIDVLPNQITKRREVNQTKMNFKYIKARNMNLPQTRSRRSLSFHQVLSAGRQPQRGFDPGDVEVRNRVIRRSNNTCQVNYTNPTTTRSLTGFPNQKQPACQEVKGEGETGCKASVRGPQMSPKRLKSHIQNKHIPCRTLELNKTEHCDTSESAQVVSERLMEL